MAAPVRRDPSRLSDEDREQSVEVLRAFLRAELFAVETYDAALAKVRDRRLCAELARLRESHRRRASLLAARLAQLGEPCHDGTSEGPWGAFANAFRRVVVANDEWTTLAALREGEAWGVRDYEIDLDELDDTLRDEISGLVLPEQRRTSARLHRLARSR